MMTLTLIVFLLSAVVFWWGFLGLIKPKFVFCKTRGQAVKVMLSAFVVGILAMLVKPVDVVSPDDVVEVSAGTVAEDKQISAKIEADRILEKKRKAVKIQAERIAEEKRKKAQAEAERIAEEQRIAAKKRKAAQDEADRIAAEKRKVAQDEADRIAEEKQAAENKKQIAAFDYSVESFIERYNNAGYGGTTARVKRKSKEVRDSGDYIYQYTPETSGNYAFLIDGNSSSKMNSVVVMASGDGSTASGAQVLSVLFNAIAASNSKFDETNVGEIYDSLGVKVVNGFNSSTVSDGVNYEISYTDGLGIMLIIKPEKI